MISTSPIQEDKQNLEYLPNLDAPCVDTPIIPTNQKQSKLKRKLTWKEFKPVSSYIVTPSVRNYWDILLNGFNKDSRNFVYHLKATTGELLIRFKAGYHPIYSLWRKKHFREAEIGVLELTGIIQIDHSYSVSEHECKKYRINPEILEKLTELTFQDLINLNHTRYDLIKNRVNNKVLVSTLFDESGNKIPDLIAERIKGYSPTKFSWGGILKVVIMRRNEAYRIKKQQGKNSKAYQSAYSRYRNDLDKLSKLVTDCGAVQLEGDIWIYKAPYKSQASGRLTHIGGGFQSASRAFTAAAFINITGYINYDMESAQPNCMAQLLESLGLDATFIREEILDKQAKAALFEKCGIRKQAGKDYLIALLIGSPLVETSQETSNRFKQIARLIKEWDSAQEKGETKKHKRIKPHATFCILLKEFKNDPKLAFDALQRINHYFAPLIKVIKEYRCLLLRLLCPKTDEDRQLPRPAWLITHKGKTYVKNKSGANLCIDEIRVDRLVSKVTAHLLQGMEAAYMAYIIKLGKKYGYTPVQDFHDGAIIDGTVPIKAQLEAARLSGVQGKLEIKEFENPFVDISAINEAAKKWGFADLINNEAYKFNNYEELDESEVAFTELTEATDDSKPQQPELVNNPELYDFLKDDTQELDFVDNAQIEQWRDWFKTIENIEEQRRHLERYKRYVKRIVRQQCDSKPPP